MKKLLASLVALALFAWPAGAQQSVNISNGIQGATPGSVPPTGPNVPMLGVLSSTGNAARPTLSGAEGTGVLVDISSQATPITPATATATKGVLLGSIYNSTLPTFTNGQQGAVQVDSNGVLMVGGKAAHATNVIGFPVLQGFYAIDAPTAVSSGQVTYGFATLGGAQVVYPWASGGSTWSFASVTGGIVSTTTATTLKAAGAAGQRNYLNKLQVAHDVLGAVTELAIRDGAAGTVLWRTKLQVTATDGQTFNFEPPLRGTAATLMEVVTLTSVTGGVFVNAQGFQGP